jgi:hypothetical protein
MIHEFCFTWNGRRWNGYFNAIARETVIAHFEDDLIREAIGQTLKYSKTENGAISFLVDAAVQQSHAGIYDAIRKGVEVRLGKPLQHYLN